MNSNFSKEDLQDLVNVAGHALEVEDRFIAGCVTTRPELYADGRPVGILRLTMSATSSF